MQKNFLLIIDAEIQNTKVDKTTTTTKLLLCFVLTSCSTKKYDKRHNYPLNTLYLLYFKQSKGNPHLFLFSTYNKWSCPGGYSYRDKKTAVICVLKVPVTLNS